MMPDQLSGHLTTIFTVIGGLFTFVGLLLLRSPRIVFGLGKESRANRQGRILIFTQQLNNGYRVLKRGSNGVCELWSVAEPSQNKKRKARPAKTEGGKRCVILEDDDLDTGEELPINALLELTNESLTNSAPPNRHLSSLLGRHAFDLRAPGIVLYDLGFVPCLLPPECAEDMPAPRHAASHPITGPRRESTLGEHTGLRTELQSPWTD